MSTPYTPPRGADGKILLFDVVDAEPQPAAPPPRPVLTTAPVGGGEMPTSFDALRPGQPTPNKAASKQPTWREWVGLGAAVLIVALGGYALLGQREAPAPTALPTAPPAATVAAPTAPRALTLPRAVVAYSEPHGTPVGALEPGRGYAVIAEEGDWRHLDVEGSGAVWVRAWEMDGISPPTPLPSPTPIPSPTADARPVIVQPVGPAVTCVPVVDGDNGNAYLGDACGVTSEERQQRALELLQAATP